MEELLERLPKRESLRKMFGEMTSLPIDEVIERLLTDFERTVAEYRLHDFVSKRYTEKRPTKAIEKKLVEAGIEEHESHGNNGRAASPVLPVSEPKPVDTVPPVEVTPQVEGKQDVDAKKPPHPEAVKDVQDEEKDKHVQRAAAKRNTPEPAIPPTLQLNPIKLELPKIQLKIPELPPLKKQTEPQRPTPPEPKPETKEAKKESVRFSKAQEEELKRLEEMAKKLEADYQTKKTEPAIDPAVLATKEAETKNIPLVKQEAQVVQEMKDEPSFDEDDEEIDGAKILDKRTLRARYHFGDDEYAYLHAVSKIPEGESPVSEPFMLEEKGIDGHEFAFALDYNGFRYYLSKFNPNEMNVSKSMVLLLNKQESLQCQGAHESSLNDLRAHGILLPFEFGTVVRGRDSLLSLIDKNADDIEDALAEVEKTTWWTVTASVLDSTIAKIVGTDAPTVSRERARERASYTSTPHGKKFDIKTLERILQREKKLAEAVHSGLSAVAKRSDVDTMVGLGSGSSEDWKVILKASYDVPRKDIGKFNHAVTELQYHHLQYDLMLALSGKKDSLALRRK